MATTGISTAFRETLETGKPVFSGFETGVPDGNGVRAFITAAIGDVGNPPAGVIAFKIPGSDIQQIIDMPPEPGESVRIYLLDADLTLLAGTIEGQRPDTRLTVKTAGGPTMACRAGQRQIGLAPIQPAQLQEIRAVIGSSAPTRRFNRAMPPMPWSWRLTGPWP